MSVKRARPMQLWHDNPSFHFAKKDILYAAFHRQDSTYYSLCYTSCGAIAEMKNSSMVENNNIRMTHPVKDWLDLCLFVIL